MKQTTLFNFLAALILASAVALFAPLTAVANPSGMVSYWRFDDGSGILASDSINGHHGTVYGATWIPGQVNGALRFDGVDDYISIGDIGLGTSAFSIALWFKTDNWGPSGRSAGALIANDYCFWCSPSRGWLFWIYTDRFWFPVNHNASVTGAEYPDYKDKWTYVVFTRDVAGQTKIYFDGLEVSSYVEQTPWVTPYFPSGEHIEIGRRADEGWYFTGIIDEVAIYNRDLTPEEIQQHYQKGLAGIGYDSPTATKEISGEDRIAETPIFDVFADDIFTYTIEVENPFEQSMYVMVGDTLDTYLEYVWDSLAVDGTPAGNDAFASGDLLYTDHLLNADETLSLSFDVRVQDIAPIGWIFENVAEITAYLDPLNIPGTTLAVVEAIAPQGQVVPEPSTLLLLGIGMLGGAALLRRTQRKKP